MVKVITTVVEPTFFKMAQEVATLLFGSKLDQVYSKLDIQEEIKCIRDLN